MKCGVGESRSEPEPAEYGGPEQNPRCDLADNFRLAKLYEYLPEQLCQADQQKQDKKK